MNSTYFIFHQFNSNKFGVSFAVVYINNEIKSERKGYGLTKIGLSAHTPHDEYTLEIYKEQKGR